MIVKLKRFLSIPQSKIKKVIKRRQQEIKQVQYIDEEKIVNDLIENGCSDLYLFLLNHIEIKKLKASLQEGEAFRIFLLFCINQEYALIKTKDFNNSNIRIVLWE